MSRRHEIRLTSGRDIHLEILFQYRTYRGLLDGLPTKALNRELVNRALEHAKDKLWLCGSPFLIHPVEIPLQIPKEDWFREDEEPAEIPRVVCLAEFESYQPAKNPDENYSYLSIVWFQNEFAMPIDPTVEERIRAIDWNAVASDATD